MELIRRSALKFVALAGMGLLLAGCLEKTESAVAEDPEPVGSIPGTTPPPSGNDQPPSDNGGSLSAIISATPTSGVASLTVNVDAGQSTAEGTITSYSWDFGDGVVQQSRSATHIYSTPGNYDLSLTVTDEQGATATDSSTIHVFSSVDNSQAIVPDSVIFYDDFQYDVSRQQLASYSRSENPFVQIGGWNGAKAENTSGSHAGYLYTVSEIPGYAGDFPGRNSSRVLAIEARPADMGGQTDFYLQYGSAQQSRETIPGNVWFQFWVYPNYYDDPTNQNDQLSEFDTRFKFIYPCNTPYPCTTGNNLWKTMLGTSSYEPLNVSGNRNELFLFMKDQWQDARHLAGANGNQENLGHTDVSEKLLPNRWTLVKIHYDTSTTQGRFEAWMKPMGGDWTKVAEWIAGETPNFTWPIDLNDIGGHRVFRMPTTMNDFDSWIYLDDFAMANAEEDLPVYPY